MSLIASMVKFASKLHPRAKKTWAKFPVPQMCKYVAAWSLKKHAKHVFALMYVHHSVNSYRKTFLRMNFFAADTYSLCLLIFRTASKQISVVCSRLFRKSDQNKRKKRVSTHTFLEIV